MTPKSATPLIALVLLAASARADDTHFSFGVQDVKFTSNLPGPVLSLKNVSPHADVSQRDLRVTSADPVLDMQGRVTCRSGAVAKGAQIIFGQPIVHYGNGGPIVYDLFTLGEGAPKQLPGTSQVENVQLTATLPVSKSAGNALVDFTFNPAAHFEKRLLAFVQKGGSAAEWMRQTESFDMDVPVAIVGWCETDQLGEAWDYPGVRVTNMTLSILYEGDLDAVDGPGVRAFAGVGGWAPTEPSRARETATARGHSGGGPPARDTPPRAPAPPAVRAPDPAPRPTALLLPAVQKAREAAIISDDPAVGLLVPAVQQ